MEIWQVTFLYETPGEYASNKARTIYNVVAKSEVEAVTKARINFSDTPAYSDLGLSKPGRVESKARKITSQRIKFPRLTLSDDRERYRISARVKNGSSLEYLVLEDK